MNEQIIKVSGKVLPISDAVRRRSPDLHPRLFVSENRDVMYIGQVLDNKPLPNRIRQSHKPLLNKLELEWLAVLEHDHPSSRIHKQSIRWRLGNGIWYKPDFAAFVRLHQFTCWEVKGPHAFRGGFENLKVAASLYPEVSFVLVWKDKGGAWQQQYVEP